jgi:hypothetical protein
MSFRLMLERVSCVVSVEVPDVYQLYKALLVVGHLGI